MSVSIYGGGLEIGVFRGLYVVTPSSARNPCAASNCRAARSFSTATAQSESNWRKGLRASLPARGLLGFFAPLRVTPPTTHTASRADEAYNKGMGETIRKQTGSLPQHANFGRAGDPGPGGESSLGGTLGAGAGTAYRLLRTKLRGSPGRNQRLLRGLQAGVSGFAGPLRNVLRVLFLEVSGFVFLIISLAMAVTFIRECKRFAMHETGVGRVILAGAVSAMFLYFGVSSFWRARRRQAKDGLAGGPGSRA